MTAVPLGIWAAVTAGYALYVNGAASVRGTSWSVGTWNVAYYGYVDGQQWRRGKRAAGVWVSQVWTSSGSRALWGWTAQGRVIHRWGRCRLVMTAGDGGVGDGRNYMGVTDMYITSGGVIRMKNKAANQLYVTFDGFFFAV